MKHRFQQKLQNRIEEGSLRSLSSLDSLVDFYSNDYLGLSIISIPITAKHGSTGSRLISGNSSEAVELELFLARYFNSESALVFNSGYDANVGFFSSVPQKGDTIIYDEYIHASVRDGIRLSLANSYKFKHNDLTSLENLIRDKTQTVFVAIESLYSMDGDLAPIDEILQICEKYDALLIVDEAHGAGVLGENGKGLSFKYCKSKALFARLVTFGKAYGSHGAAILGSSELIHFLVNFARSFIYSTALPPYQYNLIQNLLSQDNIIDLGKKLQENIALFRKEIPNELLISNPLSPIQCFLTPGNENAKKIAAYLQTNGYACKAILSPTVPKSKERIRICFHAFNTKQEIESLAETLKKYFN